MPGGYSTSAKIQQPTSFRKESACTSVDRASLVDDSHEGDSDPVYAAPCCSKDPGPVAARDQAATVGGDVL